MITLYAIGAVIAALGIAAQFDSEVVGIDDSFHIVIVAALWPLLLACMLGSLLRWVVSDWPAR